MGTNSALITRKVIDNSYEVVAVLTFAVCQAIDLLSAEESQKLCKNTLSLHELIRKQVAVVEEDVPQFENIRIVIDILKENQI